MKNNQDERTYTEETRKVGDKNVYTLGAQKSKLLSEHIRDVQNDNVNSIKFIIKNGVTLPRNLAPIYTVDEKMANYYANVHRERGSNPLTGNKSKTFSLNEESKLSLIYNNGKLIKTPLFAPGDVGKLIKDSIENVTNEKMSGYEKVARALRASEALDQDNIARIVSGSIESGDYAEGLSRKTSRTSTILNTSADRGSMDAHIGRSFNDFIYEMKRQTTAATTQARAETSTLRSSISKNNMMISDLKSQLSESPNRGSINKLIDRMARENTASQAQIDKFEKEYGTGISEEVIGRWRKHVSNLRGESPTVTKGLVGDYTNYLSKRDAGLLSYFDKMNEVYDEADEVGEFAITEMINDNNIMKTSTHESNPKSEKSYRNIRNRIEGSVVRKDGSISDDVLERMKKGIDKLEYRNLTYSEKEVAMGLIDDGVLKDIVQASYVDYQVDGNVNYKTLGFVGLRDTTYKTPDEKYSARIAGLLDIEGFDEGLIDKYMKETDAYSIADRRESEALKLDDNLYADTLLTKVKHFKELQANKDTASIRAQFDAVTLHSTKESAPSFVKKPQREEVILNPRVKSMIPEDLAKKVPKMMPAKSDIFDSLNTNENVFDLLKTVIEPLANQNKNASLKREAEDAIVEFDLFRQIRKANGLNEDNVKDIDAMSNIIGAAYDGKYPAGGVYGKPARAYRDSLNKLGIGDSTPFANLSEPEQLTVMNSIEAEYVTKLSKTVDGLEYSLREFSENDEVRAMREAIAEQKSSVNSELIEVENMYNGGLTKDPEVEIEEAKKLLWEHDYDTRSKIEAEREAMRKQRIVADENSGNAISNVQKKDYDGLIAYAKGTSEVRRVKDIGKIGSRPNYLTYEEIKEGIVRNGDEVIPVEQFKQFHTMMDATQLMKGKPTGEYKDVEKYMFTPEEWKRGSVVVGDTELPITQFKEYYDRDVRINRASWLRNNDQHLVGDVMIQPEYANHSVPQEMPSLSKPEFKNKDREFVWKGKRPPSKTVARNTSRIDEMSWIKNLRNKLISESDPEVRGTEKFRELRKLAAYFDKPTIGEEEIRRRALITKYVPDYIDLSKAFPSAEPKKDIVQAEIPSWLDDIDLSDDDPLEKLRDTQAAYEKIPLPVKKDTGYDIGFSQEDYHNIHKLSVLEDVLSGEDAQIVVNKPIDKKLIENLARWHGSKTSVVTKGSSISKEIIGIDGNTVALRERSALATDTKFNINYTGEGTLFDALMTFDDIMNTSVKQNARGKDIVENIRRANTDKSDLLSEVDHKEALNEMSRDRMSDIIGERNIDSKDVQITRQHLLDMLMSDEVDVNAMVDDIKVSSKVPRVIHDTALLNFSWMRVDVENISDHAGAGYLATRKALNAVNDDEILKAFKKHDINLEDFHTVNKEVAHSILSDAISHKVKLELLFEYLGKDGSPTGDSADTAIRVAMKSMEANGINPTADNVISSLFQLRKGLSSMDDETKQYFGVIDKLIANDSEVIQKLLDSPREVLTDFIEVLSQSNEENFDEVEFENDFQEQLSRLLGNSSRATESVEEIVIRSKNINPSALDEKVEQLALESDYYLSKSKKYLRHRSELSLRSNTSLTSHDKLNEGQGAMLMMNTLDDFESDIAGKDLQAILSKQFKFGKKNVKTTKQLIVRDVLNSFTGQNMTLKKMNETFLKTLDRYVDDGIKENAKGKINKLQALRVLNEEVPESALNYVRSQGGLAKAFVDLGIAKEGEVGNLGVIKQAIENMEFSSVEDVKNFSLIQDLIPGLTLNVQTKDARGNVIIGTLGRHKTYKGLTDSVITTTSGEKIKLVNAHTESLRILSLNGLDSKDFRIANENVATKHVSKAIEAGATSYNMVAGFSGNYNVMSRRPFGTGAVDPMTIIKNMSDFTSDKSQTGLVFDFETTGLPNKMDSKIFSPVEFSYLAFDKKYRTKDGMLNAEDNISRIVTKYAKPNKDVKKFFAEALENNTYGDFFSTSREMVGKDDTAFMMLKNYAKYDNTEVSFGGKSYTWGSILTADMSSDKKNLGKVIAYIGDEEVHTNMDIAQIVNQVKSSGQEVFEYLASGGAKGNDAKFGIDAKHIKTEKELVKLAIDKMKSYTKLIGHNITTADLKWVRQWADRLGIEEVPSDLELKAIDTQDALQATQPGRNSNKLSNFSDDVASAHLAYADIETNIKLFNKIASSDPMGTLSREVNEGIKNGDYLVKIANQELGMNAIPKGRYQLESIENGIDGVSGIMSLRNMSTNKVEEYQAENLAVIKKELADNWLNFGKNGESALEHFKSISADDSAKTLYNAYGNPALVDRYIQYGNMKSFSISKGIMEEMHNAVYNATSEKGDKAPTSINLLGINHKDVSEVSDGVFESRTMSDIERFIISNTSKLTGDNYIQELVYLSDNSSTRRDEFDQVVKYFDTSEGNLAREYLKKIRHREQAGIISTTQRQEFGDMLYQRVMDIKGEAIKSNQLNGAEATIEGKFVAGVITQKNLPDSYKRMVGRKAVETFQDKELIIDMRNAEQTRRSIFSMGDDLAYKMFYRSSTGMTIEEARSKVVNEVILPALKGYSNNKELVKSIEAYGTAGANPDYKHAVNSLAAELSSRKVELTGEGGVLHGKEYKVLATGQGVNKATHPEIFRQIEEAMSQTIDDIDYEASVIKRIVDGKVVDIPVPGGVEKIREIVGVVEANEKTALDSIASTDIYKKLVDGGYDPIEAGVNILPNFDFTHNNSGGIAALNRISKISEWRITGDENTRWMTFQTASDLIGVANNVQTHTDAYSIGEVVKAFQNKAIEPEVANYYKSNFRNAISFIESKTKHSIDDIAGIAALNKATVQKISKEYAEQRNSSTYDNAKFKSSIMKELMTRANEYQDVVALDGGLITNEMVAKNPTKYNAMRALGLIQPTADKKAFYTGSIGGIGDFNNVYDPSGKSIMTLDPAKVLLLGNDEMHINGSTINDGTIKSNQLAGVPITHLTKAQLEHVANDKYTKGTQKTTIESYLERIKGIKDYDQAAVGRYDNYVGKVKNMSPTPSLDTITGLNKRVVSEHGNKQAAKEAAHDAVNKHQKVKSIDPSKIIDEVKRVTDSPLYSKLSDTMSDAKTQAKKALKGIEGSNLVKFGALGLGVGVGLKLIGNYSSSGRRQEESPNGGAPRVDGTYDRSYNGDRPTIGNRTVRLEENGRGLNVSAKAKNRNNTSDNELGDMLSGMLGKSFGSSVNIKYQDDRSVIDNSYVQNLVSNALFG